MSHLLRPLAVAVLLVSLAASGGAQMTLGTPKSQSAADSISRSNAAASAAQSSSSIAVLPFATLLAGGPADDIAARLGGFATAAFTASETWKVLDRTTDTLLREEMKRVQSADQFESAIRVQQGRATNARFMLLGLLQNAGDDTTMTSDRRVMHTVTLEYRVRVQDVETKQTVIDSSIRVSSADVLSSSLVIGELKQAGIKGMTRALESRLSRSRVRKDEGTRAEARVVASNVIAAYSLEEALDRALKVAEQRLNGFVVTTTTAARRVSASR